MVWRIIAHCPDEAQMRPVVVNAARFGPRLQKRRFYGQ
jgi:hypothetical protein